ncbi:SDR family NAD(P)-dependent oxidoreductase [Sphingopyxis indica]|uniref:3-oxoacyl-[acyl-carrier protein] reductase n=1 Tax=Sphingopyxis indica TaxID=436663 RepID=A0A239HFD2_9SPHN|nr:SDR family oxidoreductase [Sphingopyxis indica]SNS78984.1 3-oxoacyl-[acyl-carrier protein] reductase [Sphingopyxis indica]
MADILDLAGRVALVTGAGQGIGRQIALHLSGHNSGGVAVNDYYLDRAEAVASEIRAAGGKAIAVQADVTDLEAVKDMNERIVAELGAVGVLVNNAGNMGANPSPDVRKPFWETGPDVWNQSIGVNLYGVMNCAATVVPGMIARQAPARIVTIISDAGRYGDAGLEAYAAAKAGAAGFSRSAARSLARFGITVNCVAIAATRTAATERLMDDPERMKRVFDKYIVRRPGEPVDIANMVLFLASDASSWISGQTYPVNGGMTLAL